MNFYRTHTAESSWCRKALWLMLAVIPMMAIMSACGGSDSVYCSDFIDPEEDANIYLTLTVNVSENVGRASRAAGDLPYYYELPLPRNEKLNSLRVFIVKPDNTIEAHRQVSYDSDGYMIGLNSLTFRLTPGDKHIYLVGNDSSLPESLRSQMDALAEKSVFPTGLLDNVVLSREATAPFFTSDENIPMTEEFDLTLVADEKAMDASQPTYIYKTLFVTRIATKYTIFTPDDYASLKIKLTDIATTQYLMPHGVTYSPDKDSEAEVINGVAGRRITQFEVPDYTSSPVADFVIDLGNNKTTITGKDGKVMYRYEPFYLMETAGSEFKINALIDEKPLVVDGVDYANDEWFEDQTLNNLPLLPRNTQVIINMSALFNLSCEVDVVPYRVCTLDPVFGLGDLSAPDSGSTTE